MRDHEHTTYLIDGSGYIFRAFYGVQPLSTADGFPTNALFGFLRMLFKTLGQAKSEKVAVVFDAGRHTFRNDLDPEYKANRTECPPELAQQMPYFREFCRAVGLPVLEKPGYEADDIIGTLSRALGTTGGHVVIVSGDKDLMQLVDDCTEIWDTMKDQRFTAPEVQERFGVPPSQVVEVLALTGDASDNVAGIDGVGPKTAAQLIQKYQSTEGVISNAAAIKEDSAIRNRKKIAEAIESNAARLRLSRKLVEIDCAVPLTDSPDEPMNVEVLLERKPFDVGQLAQLCERFEFSSLMRELPLANGFTAPSKAGNDFEYRCIRAQDFDDWLDEFKVVPEFAFDIETTSLAVHEAKIVGFSFCWNDSKASYIPIGHVDAATGALRDDQVTLADFIAGVAERFKDPSVGKCGLNSKYDLSILELHGVPVSGLTFDSMVAAYLLNPDARAFNLTVLARDYLKLPVIEFDEILAGAPSFNHVEFDPATKYACQDAHYAWLLKEVLGARISAENLSTVLGEVEVPLIPVLAGMERAGIGVDVEILRQMSKEFADQLAVLEQQIYATAGSTFNINSTKQLADILFVKLAIPTKGLKKTKTGISTDSSVLERLAAQHPLPRLILDYRLLHKLKSTYTDALVEDISPVTGRVHTRLNQTVAGTGRLSSSDPNLQNIPVQSKEGRRIRSALIPAPGKIFISADYSQIELRLLAHLSEDENLIKAFCDGQDIHASTAREIMGLGAAEDVPDDVRRIGKTINFGIAYGMGAFRLGRELGIPISQASLYINNYFDRYPKVRTFFKHLEEDATAKGYVTTLFGRKRMISSLDTSGRDQGFAMRAAINAPIQGSAADIIKVAMIRLNQRLRSEAVPATLILQIHDELLVEADDRGAAQNEELVRMVTHTMEEVMKLRVPLRVDAGLGYSWQEAQS